MEHNRKKKINSLDIYKQIGDNLIVNRFPFPSSRLTGKNLPVRREDGKGSKF